MLQHVKNGYTANLCDMKKKTSSQSERSSPVSTTVLRAAGVTRCTVLSGFVYVLRKAKRRSRDKEARCGGREVRIPARVRYPHDFYTHRAPVLYQLIVDLLFIFVTYHFLHLRETVTTNRWFGGAGPQWPGSVEIEMEPRASRPSQYNN